MRLLLFSLLLTLLTAPSRAQEAYQEVLPPWHQTSLQSLALSHDQSTAVSASVDGWIHCWRFEKTRPVFSVRLDDISCLALSPDGGRLAVANGTEIAVYSLRTGEREGTLSGHEEAISALQFSPSGEILGSASKDKTVRLWDPVAGQEKTRLVHSDVCSALAFDPAKPRLATSEGWEFGKFQIWDIESGQVEKVLSLDRAEEKAHPSSYVLPANDLAFSPDGRLLASGNYAGVTVWDAGTGLVEAQFPIPQSMGRGITGVRFLDSGLYAEGDGVVYRLDPKTKAGEAWWRLPGEVVRTAFRGDGSLFTGKLHGQLSVAGKGEPATWWAGAPEAWFRTIAAVPGTTLFLSGCDDGRLIEWDSVSATVVRTLPAASEGVRSLVVLPNGQKVMHGTKGGQVVVRSYPELRVEALLEGHTGTVTGLAVSQDGRRAITSSDDKTLRVWNLQTGKADRTLQGHTAEVTGVSVAPDGLSAASVSEDGTTRLWDLKTGQELAVLMRETRRSPLTSVAHSPDGRYLVVSEAFLSEHDLIVWDLDSRSVARAIPQSDGVMRLKFLPSGHLMTTDLGGRLCEWDLATGELVHSFQGGGYGWDLAFSTDLRALALLTTGQEATVRFWRRPAR